MARYLKLQVPSSCKENWSNMKPDQNGRYCFSCQKSVVDFTQMTDNELVNYFKTHKGSTCGRFTESQLNKDVAFPRKPLPWIKYFFKFSLPAFLFSFKSTGEARKLPTPMEITSVKSKGTVAHIIRDTLPASGYIYDENGTPLAKATVVVKGTNKGTLTDEKGRFSFNGIVLPATLLVTYFGFVSSEWQLFSAEEAANIKIQLASDELREVVTMGIVLVDIEPEKTKEKTERDSVLTGKIVAEIESEKIEQETEKITIVEKQTSAMTNDNLQVSSDTLVYPDPVAENIQLQLAVDELRDSVFMGKILSEIETEKITQQPEKITKMEKPSSATTKDNLKLSSDILVYPNPVIAGRNITLECRSFEHGNYLAEWFTTSGQLVKASKINYDKKNTRISLPINEMPPGTYFLKMTHQDGKHYSQQVVIRN